MPKENTDPKTEEKSLNEGINNSTALEKKPKEPKVEKARATCCPISQKAGLSLVKILFVALLALLVFTLVGGIHSFSKFKNLVHPENSQKSRINPLTDKTDRNTPLVVPAGAAAEEDAVTQVVEKYSPAVVSIIITKDIPKIQNFFFDPFSDGNSMNSFDPFGGQGGSSLDQFFGGNGGNQGGTDGSTGGTRKVEIGGGTGFIVSEEGMIVTNRHVVSDQNADYTVLTNDGREYDAKVLGRDSSNDVAVIKIDPNNPKKGKGEAKMETLPLGDSSAIKIGQTVIAIGNALGEFRNTVSKGIISGLSRNITAGGMGDAENLEQLIQTDAAINQGNSGGPLFNLKGEVIGINVAIAAGAQNIGFALPINSVKSIIQNVEKNGKIVQPYLGVRYVAITQDLKEKNNLPFDYGVLVLRGQNVSELAVMPGSPADKAGITENDIILEVNGTKIDEKNSLVKMISGFEVGKEIELKIWHKGEEKTIKVNLVESPGR